VTSAKIGKVEILGSVFLAVLTMLSVAWGQSGKPTSLADLAAYTGADREQRLVAGAKIEGKVFWYTSLTGGPNQEIPKAFEAKYPGVKVETYRGSSKDLIAKILAEAQAKRYLMDTIEGTLPILRAMRDMKLLVPFGSPHLATYPEGTKEKAGKGLFFWASARETYIGLGYNKNSISPNSLPKSYDDLLKPELKGKLGFSTTDTGSRVIGAMLKFKGEDYLNRLKAQTITLYAISGRALLDLVISGEVGASPTIFRSQATTSIGKGAPIGWVPMDIVPTNAGGVAVAARSPHPHAALLLLDFILGPEGQKILENFGLESPAKDFGFNRWYPEEGLTTEQYEEVALKWDKLLRQIGRR
jgi:iron(III) transport system substrate-binding protein